jgi:hypothetical protein
MAPKWPCRNFHTPAIQATFAGDDELLVGTTAGVLTTTLSSPQWRLLPGSTEDRVRSVYVVTGRSLTRVSYADTIDLIDTDRGHVVDRRERGRVTAALVSPWTGESVTASHTQVVIDSGDGNPDEIPAGPTSIDIAPSGDVLVGQYNGQLAVVPRIGPHRLSFVAHAGQILGVGATEDGKWVSVGTDSQLRVWDPTTQSES